MKTAIIVLTGLLIGASPAAAGQQQDDLKLHVAIGAYMASNGADLATTMYVLGAGTGREANPVFAPLTNYPAAAGAVKMVVATATSYLLIRTHPKHPKLAFWASIAGATLYTAVSVHNAKLIPPRR